MSLQVGDYCETSDGKFGVIKSMTDETCEMQMYEDGDPTDVCMEYDAASLVKKTCPKPKKSVHKTVFNFQIKSLGEEEEGFAYFEGYGAVFNNVDSDNDIIIPGAFTETLASDRKVKMCWQHSFYDVIGGFTEMREDDKGLFVKGRINLGVEKGREAYALLKAGDIDSMSIGYSCQEREYRDGIRYIKKATLYEVSLVTEPANSSAVVTSVKFDQIKDLASIEKLLMTKGFTSADAKSLISTVKELSLKRDAGEEQPKIQSSVDAGEDDMAFVAAFAQIKSITSNIRNKSNV